MLTGTNDKIKTNIQWKTEICAEFNIKDPNCGNKTKINNIDIVVNAA